MITNETEKIGRWFTAGNRKISLKIRPRSMTAWWHRLETVAKRLGTQAIATGQLDPSLIVHTPAVCQLTLSRDKVSIVAPVEMETREWKYLLRTYGLPE